MTHFPLTASMLRDLKSLSWVVKRLIGIFVMVFLLCREDGTATLSTCLIRASPSTPAPSVPDVSLRKSTPLVSSYEVTPVSEMKRTVTWQRWLSSALYKNFHGFYFPSARCQDAAAFGGDEEGVGWSCELHLWPERRLQQTFPGAESCHVSHITIMCDVL